MRVWAPVGGAALAAAVLAAGGWGLSHPPVSAVGRGPLPQVSVELLNGSALDLSSYRGRPLVVNFWASWCADCRTEQPLLDAAASTHPDVAFVGLLYGDTPSAARDYESRTHAYDYPLGFSDGAARLFGADSVPSTVFLDRAGSVRGRVSGPLTQPALARLLQEIEA